MRYATGRKDGTRQQIIDAAAARFRADGVAASGLAGVMADAGLTNGAFYTHFKSKDELVRETLVTTLDRRATSLREAAAEGTGLPKIIRDYLSPRHRDDPAKGCPTSALVAEVARQPAATRMAFTDRVGDIIALLAAQLPSGAPAARRRTATALYAMMIGTLQLARAVTDRGMSDQILRDGAGAAIRLAGQGGGAG